jgi:hypothetical protein
VKGRRTLERLWATLDPEARDAAATAELLRMGAHQDVELRRVLVEDERLDGMLLALGRAGRTEDAFSAATCAALDLEEDGQRFVARVVARLDGPAERATGGPRDRLRVSLRSVGLAVATALCAAAAMFVLRDWRGPEPALRLTGVEGASRSELPPGTRGRPQGIPPRAASWPLLPPGSQLAPVAGAQAFGRLADGIELTAAGPARVDVTPAPTIDSGGRAYVNVVYGTVSVRLTDTARGVVLAFPVVQAIVDSGPAEFSADVKPEGSYVRVETGLVKVRGPRSTLEVSGGQLAIARADDVSIRRPFEPRPGQPGETILAYDFEKPLQVKLGGGHVTRCPPPIREGLCLTGTRYDPRFPRSFGIRIVAPGDSLFRYDPDLIVSFDYWIGAWTGDRKPRFTVGLQAALDVPGTMKGLYEAELEPPHPHPARWVTAHVPISDMRFDGRLELTPAAGVRIMRFVTDYAVQDVFYIDNVRVWRPSK